MVSKVFSREDRHSRGFWILLGVAVVLTLFRLWIGYQWFSELGWKAPWEGAGGFGCDAYRFQAPAGKELHGLCDWMQREVDHPLFGFFGSFVKGFIIPNFDFFAWVSYLVELSVALLLFLGLLTRLGGIVSTLWTINLIIGLSAVPGEGPFSYVGFLIPCLIFAVIGSRYQFALDDLLVKRFDRKANKGKLNGKLLHWLSGAQTDTSPLH